MPIPIYEDTLYNFKTLVISYSKPPKVYLPTSQHRKNSSEVETQMESIKTCLSPEQYSTLPSCYCYIKL